jgi:uncharacterized protein (TIGR01777 family)
MKVLVTGSSGLIGTALCESLRHDGADVYRLVRRSPQKPDEIFWNPASGDLDQASVEGFDAVIHLAGAGIGDKRWNEARRRVILDSRVDSTRLLADRLAAAAAKPDVFVSGSAIGFYGNRSEPVDEQSEPAAPSDFLSDVTIAWEQATKPAEEAGIRTVHIRTGIVLAKQGGALAKLLLPFRLGFGGKLGRGDTWWSWISLQDEIRAIRHLIDQPLEGPVNLTAPNPVTNKVLTKALGRVLRRPTIFAVPRFALEVLLGKELAAALLFTSAQVIPTRLLESGFVFEAPTIEDALSSVLGKPQ